MTDRVLRLVDALRLLSLPAPEQLEALAGLGIPDVVDELALYYDDIAPAAADMLALGEISRPQRDAVSALNETLGAMSRPQNDALWTREALTSAREWADVREQAQASLNLFFPTGEDQRVQPDVR